MMVGTMFGDVDPDALNPALAHCIAILLTEFNLSALRLHQRFLFVAGNAAPFR